MRGHPFSARRQSRNEPSKLSGRNQMDLRNVWIVRGTLDGPSGTLSTSVTVSGVTTLIDGSEIRVVVPEPASLGYEKASVRGIGEAKLVTSNLAFQTGKTYAFNFGECFFIDADGHE